MQSEAQSTARKPRWSGISATTHAAAHRTPPRLACLMSYASSTFWRKVCSPPCHFQAQKRNLSRQVTRGASTSRVTSSSRMAAITTSQCADRRWSRRKLRPGRRQQRVVASLQRPARPKLPGTERLRRGRVIHGPAPTGPQEGPAPKEAGRRLGRSSTLHAALRRARCLATTG